MTTHLYKTILKSFWVYEDPPQIMSKFFWVSTTKQAFLALIIGFLITAPLTVLPCQNAQEELSAQPHPTRIRGHFWWCRLFGWQSSSLQTNTSELQPLGTMLCVFTARPKLLKEKNCFIKMARHTWSNALECIESKSLRLRMFTNRGHLPTQYGEIV